MSHCRVGSAPLGATGRSGPKRLEGAAGPGIARSHEDVPIGQNVRLRSDDDDLLFWVDARPCAGCTRRGSCSGGAGLLRATQLRFRPSFFDDLHPVLPRGPRKRCPFAHRGIDRGGARIVHHPAAQRPNGMALSKAGDRDAVRFRAAGSSVTKRSDGCTGRRAQWLRRNTHELLVQRFAS